MFKKTKHIFQTGFNNKGPWCLHPWKYRGRTTPAHFHSDPFCSLFHMPVLSDYNNYSSTQTKFRGREETNLWNAFQRSKKEILQSSSRKSLLIIGPNCLTCPFLDQLLAQGAGLPLFRLDLSLQLKHMGLAGAGLTLEQNWTSARMQQAGSRCSLQEQFHHGPPCLPAATWHHGLGKDKLLLSPHLFKLTSAEMYIFPSALWSLLSLLTSTVTSLDPLLPPWYLLLDLPHPTTPIQPTLVLRPTFNTPLATPRKTASFLGRWSSAALCMSQRPRKVLSGCLWLSAQMVSGNTGPHVVLSLSFGAAIHKASTWYAKAISSFNPARSL